MLRSIRRAMTARSPFVKLVSGVALALGVNAAQAAAYQGKVLGVFASNGKVIISVSQGFWDGSASTCAGSLSYGRYVVDPETAYGRTLVAIATAAKLTDRVVWAGGNGVCVSTAGGDLETLSSLDLKG